MQQNKKKTPTRVLVTGSIYQGAQYFAYEIILPDNSVISELKQIKATDAISSGIHIFSYVYGALKAIEKCAKLGMTEIEIWTDLALIGSLLSPTAKPIKNYTVKFVDTVKRTRRKGASIESGLMANSPAIRNQYVRLKGKLKRLYPKSSVKYVDKKVKK